KPASRTPRWRRPATARTRTVTTCSSRRSGRDAWFAAAPRPLRVQWLLARPSGGAAGWATVPKESRFSPVFALSPAARAAEWRGCVKCASRGLAGRVRRRVARAGPPRSGAARERAVANVLLTKPNTVHLITFWWYSVLGAKASPSGHLMNVTIVESTSLATVAYDDAWELLQLEFCSRAVYQYFGVPAAVHAALLRAPSKGSYFNRVIRGRFPYSLASNAQAGVAHAALRSERSR